MDLKRICCLIAGLILCKGNALAISAQSAIVIDADTREVLFAQSENEVLPMASTTKIMTALVALEDGDIDRSYTVKAEYAGVEGSSMYLQEGETLTIRDTLYGLMLESGNDAAVAIAGECGGFDVFVEKMNAKAESLGLSSTHFDNPNGLSSETHYTTAYELAVIAAEAMQNEEFRQIVATKNYSAGVHAMANHNKLLSLYEDAVGIKTGYTKASGRCLVSAAVRNGRTLVAVTLNAPDDWNDHMAMLEDGFAGYSEVVLHRAGDTVGMQTVYGGDVDAVPLVAQTTLTAYLTKAEQQSLETIKIAQQICYAPVIYSARAGEIEYCYGGKVLASDTMLYGQSSILPAEEKGLLARFMERFAG